ncbi:MAG: tRNA (adenosine(37)-N6)-threonylcarbamoyltransferase complex transferase subunit TsaD [Myxococcales bacterium]|nr:tRNA (adenosine(37)-N6)-threonylcarbamoyltransferase complex transferase subunit TsaD [Myxococcales bacterium]
MLVLGIESSCDETAAAVVEDHRVRSNVIYSQVAVHERYGGVVPELASRNHVTKILPVVTSALEQAAVTIGEIDGIAVTQGPGLIGSLIVGLETAKALAYAFGKPLVGVHHVEGHIMAIFLQRPEEEREMPDFPYLALAVSGGHTSLYRVDDWGRYRALGTTRDDAAGEAYDKVAKMLGLGYPGGVVIDRLAQGGDPRAIAFPRPMLNKGLDFSFSGIKTAVRYRLEQGGAPSSEQALADFVASFQEAVVDVLIHKCITAAQGEGVRDVVLAGGVAANSRLRAKFADSAPEHGLRVFATPLAYCTDNAAMIAGLGLHYLAQPRPMGFLALNAYANLPIGACSTSHG